MADVRGQVRQGADQLGTEHDTASDEGPAAYTVGHTSHHLQQQPAQAYNGYAEEGPPHGLGCHKPGAPPAHAHTSLTVQQATLISCSLAWSERTVSSGRDAGTGTLSADRVTNKCIDFEHHQHHHNKVHATFT